MSWLITGTQKLDPDAQAYIGRVEQADQANLEPAVKDAINAFVVGCKADGIWDAIKASCILAGARTLDGALVPLTGTAPGKFGTLAGWAYDRKLGLKGNGTDNYLNSNRANTADPQNSSHNSVYVSAQGNVGSGLICAGLTIAANNIHAGGSVSFFIRNRSTNATTIPYSLGFIGHARQSASGYTIRANNANTPVTETSLPPVSANVLLFSRDFTAYSNARLAFYSIGESLDLALLDARVTTLINAFASAIP